MKNITSKKLLADGIQQLELNDYHINIDLLLDYLELLAKWSKTYNLTAITDSEQMVVRHLLDSLAILPYIKGKRIIDVGTGAGLPGIPLAIALPQIDFFLLDSNKKKIRFLTEAVRLLNLTNITLVTERAEKLQPDHCFDCVITRAYSDMTTMLKQTEHLCCKKGEFLAMKGSYPDDEIKALPEDIEIKKSVKLIIPFLHGERHLIIFSRQ